MRGAGEEILPAMTGCFASLPRKPIAGRWSLERAKVNR